MGFFSQWWAVATEFFGSHEKSVETIPADTSFAGRSVIVTGATSGLGLEAAILYVQLGAETVYITARSAAKGAQAKGVIEERTGKKDVVQVRVLDMDTFDGVKHFVAGLKKDVKTIDIVLLNAGVHAFSYKKLPEGWESDLQVNVLSTTLLALLMLPWMREVKKSGQTQHLTFTGSGSHMLPDIGSPKFPKQNMLEFFNKEDNYESGRAQYANSKLLLMYASREIANLAVDDSGSPSPIVNSVCPGLIKTDISRGFKNKGLIFRWLEAIFMWWKASPAEDGAKALVVATVTNDHGKFRRPYLTDEEYEVKAKPNVTSLAGQKMQTQAWKEIVSILKEKDLEVSKIVRL